MIKNIETIKKQIESAVVVYRSGDLAKAEMLTKKLIEQHPKSPFLYNLLGMILTGQEKIEHAIILYEKSISTDPNFAMAYNNLGLLYNEHKSNTKKAEHLYKKAISLNPKLSEPYNNLGALRNAESRYKEAIDYYKKAISLNPKFSQPHHNIGNVYLTTGNFVEAKKSFKESLKLDPNHSNSHRSLSRLTKYRSDTDENFKELINTYYRINISDTENKTNLGFALGKAYEDIKNFDKSFTYYIEANTIYRKKINFSLKLEKEKFQEIKNTFHIKLYEKYQNTGSKDQSVIFILGMPRSGTTLLEQILSNHPKIFGGDEQEFIPELLQKKFGNHQLRLFFEEIVNFDESDFKVIGEEYINKIKNISNNSEKSTDKLPENFLWIGFIKLILPYAKIIHCTRRPEDICLSLFKNHFPSGKIKYSYDLKEIVEYYNLYNDLMKHWYGLFPNFILNVKYENLISNTENEVKNLLRFCNLDWNDNCLNFYNNKRPIKTASDIQARNKIYKSSMNSWEKYEKYLKDYFKKLAH